MNILHKIALIAATALLAAGCCPCRSARKSAQPPLEGTQWQLIQLGGTKITPEAGKFTLRLLADENRLSAVGACNRLSGSYTLGQKRSLKIGPVASTMMACPGMDRERQYAAAIESATHYDMDGPMLLLLADGEVRAVFRAMPGQPKQ